MTATGPAPTPATRVSPAELSGASAELSGASAELSGASAELGAAFKGLLAAHRRLRGRETRNPSGLTDAQYGLLFSLREQQQLSSGELACAADLSPPTVAEMLDGLVAAGLVVRVRSDRDRRVVLTSLTERGHALLEARHAQFAPRWNAVVEEFSDDELGAAARVLNRLQAMFDEIAREP